MYGQPIEYLVNQGTSRQHNPPAPAAAAAAASSNEQAGNKRMADKIPPSSMWPHAQSGSPSSSSTGRPAISSQPTDYPPHGSHLGKAVEQFDLATGRTIARFKNQSAAEKKTGVGNASISVCVRGKLENAGGFGWRRPGSGGAVGADVSRHSRPAASKPSTGTYSRLVLLKLSITYLSQSYNSSNSSFLALIQSRVSSELKPAGWKQTKSR